MIIILAVGQHRPSNCFTVCPAGTSQLSGTLPSISPASRLQTLSVSNARVTGNLPLGAEAPQSLTVLDLSSNTLFGTLPAGLVTAVYLKQLNLSSNKLLGTVLNLQTLGSHLLSGASSIEHAFVGIRVFQVCLCMFPSDEPLVSGLRICSGVGTHLQALCQTRF